MGRAGFGGRGGLIVRWLRRRRLLREAEALEREARRWHERAGFFGLPIAAVVAEARAKSLREEAGRC